jgi:patatin-like phospholipase/acyl hydrolase
MRIISIDGGGYLGLATASFIRGIEQHFRVPFHERFDLFCGTSTGAIIALALASGKTGEEIVELYKQFGPEVFGPRQRIRRWIRNNLKSLVRSQYSNKALKAALETEFEDTTLGDLYEADKKVLITAFNISTGTPRIFKTDHSENLTRDNGLRVVDVMLASTAAPTFFPLVKVANPANGITETFCDGGVVANHPALLGYVEALGELKASVADIKLLSLSTPRLDLAENVNKHLKRGLWQWRKTLPAALIDSNAYTVDQIFKRLVSSYPEPGPLYERIEMQNKNALPMDRADSEATDLLEHIGETLAADRSNRRCVQTILC